MKGILIYEKVACKSVYRLERESSARGKANRLDVPPRCPPSLPI